jgi:membrane-associated protein
MLPVFSEGSERGSIVRMADSGDCRAAVEAPANSASGEEMEPGKARFRSARAGVAPCVLSPERSVPDSELLHWLSAHLVRLGPEVLFAACLLETAVFAGLVLPVGALVGFAAMLATAGVFEPVHVVVAASLGALAGDQIGFVTGRWFFTGAKPPRGDVRRIWSGALSRTDGLVRKRGMVGVMIARATPFARTVMPWFAGRSGMRWWTFLAFDILGVVLWSTIYVGGGFLAGAGWRRIAARHGETVGAILLAVVLLALLVFLSGWFRRRFGRRPKRSDPRPGPGTPAEGAAAAPATSPATPPSTGTAPGARPRGTDRK